VSKVISETPVVDEISRQTWSPRSDLLASFVVQASCLLFPFQAADAETHQVHCAQND
jgi:hypothetical protein